MTARLSDVPVPDSVSILRSLVGFPTVSPASNLNLIDYMAQFLADYGIASARVLSEDGKKANFHATVGPADAAGVVLSGHTDVVPSEGQAWQADPFVLRVTDDRAIGRGAVDMKGFIACALRCAALASTRKLSRPLILAFSHDEEIGCVGVRRLLPALAQMPVRPLLCIVGEPTTMGVVTAHKGKVMGQIRCTGLEGHSSEPEKGVNAIHLAAEMVAASRSVQARFSQVPYRDATFNVPYSTLHLGRIQGGTSVNIIPRDCVIDFEIRNLPTVDPKPMLDALAGDAARIVGPYRRLAEQVAVNIHIHNEYPGLDIDDNDPAVGFVQSLCGNPGSRKVAYGTEAGLFRNVLGLPTVVCGPGSVDQAHKPEEFVTLSQLHACDVFLERLLDRLAEGFNL
ncbi:acetylornithine deacetylase [Pseudomonas typographi]|uniref:Acetylornithine deacetylase n=1 Tax=Pseudomonas typographi TaxID=2715964 RepID=A0ABR7Z2Z6_9PSED|nr:acetylornithine deacetylase [Pseudomonas typographi]MBD1550229.1 acetylornithine deacetylase [Pseudomonas typographi]MBD1586011.1 acetylornithine deacetylase [Pseudomonas typographi]MBD1599869.1 acetylornithine deacetylase [Pseudomonas typographi]